MRRSHERLCAPRPGDSCAFVVFGAMGDLTKRKLLPSLYNLRANGLLPKNVAIVGVARRPLDNNGYREYATQALREFATRPVEDAGLGGLRRADPLRDGATSRTRPPTPGVAEALAHASKAHGTSGNAALLPGHPARRVRHDRARARALRG